MKKLHHSCDLSALEKIAELKGFKSAPADHSIYAEGSTITFIRSANNGGFRKRSEKVEGAQICVVARIVDDR